MKKVLIAAIAVAPMVLVGCSDSKNDLRKYLAETNLSKNGIECSIHVIDSLGYTDKVVKMIRETEAGGKPKFENPADAQKIAFVTQAAIMGCNAADKSGESADTVLAAVKKYLTAIESGAVPSKPSSAKPAPQPAPQDAAPAQPAAAPAQPAQ